MAFENHEPPAPVRVWNGRQTGGSELSVGCAFDDFDFLRRQAVERIHQLVYRLLQRARVSLGIALLRLGVKKLHLVTRPAIVAGPGCRFEKVIEKVLNIP